MSIIDRNELLTIYGGAVLSTVVNAIVRAVNAALEIGRALGSAIRRGVSGKACSV